MRTEDILYRRFTSPTPSGALRGQRRGGLSVRRLIDLLEGRWGSSRAAATAAGVGYSTWTHIKAGRREPSDATRKRLDAAVRGTLIGANANAYRTWPGVVALARLTISRDDETRAFNVGAWVDEMGRRRLDAVQADIVDAWLEGYDGAAARMFERVFEQGFNGGMPRGSFPQHVELIDIRWFRSQGEAELWKSAQGVVHHGR